MDNKEREMTMAGFSPEHFKIGEFISKNLEEKEQIPRLIEEFEKSKEKWGIKPDEAACRAGCFFCCYLRVELTENEVAHMLDHGPVPEDILEQAKANYAEEKGKSRREHQNMRQKCVFLGEDGKCTKYSKRPLACRGMYVMDMVKCAESFYNPGKNDSDTAFIQAGLMVSGSLGAGYVTGMMGDNPTIEQAEELLGKSMNERIIEYAKTH